MSMSRNVLAMMDAAEMTGTSASPSTMDFWRGDDGQHAARLPEQRLGDRLVAVDEQPFGPDFQHAGGVAHGLERRLQNIDAIDFGRPDDAKPPSQRHGPDLGGQAVPTGRRQHLGVRKAGNNRAFGQNHRRRNHGTGKAAPPGFIDPGNRRNGMPGNQSPGFAEGHRSSSSCTDTDFCGQPYTLRNKKTKKGKRDLCRKIPFSRTPIAGRETPHCGEKLPSSLMGN